MLEQEINGEIYKAEIYEQGYAVTKNGGYFKYIKAVSLKEAIMEYIITARLEAESETAFFRSHPELNP